MQSMQHVGALMVGKRSLRMKHGQAVKSAGGARSLSCFRAVHYDSLLRQFITFISLDGNLALEVSLF